LEGGPIHDLALRDTTVRDYMAERLPAVINANAKGDWRSVTLTWMNAVRLAGQLKIDAAIPALIESLSRSPVRGGYDMNDGIGYTFSRGAKLEFDIVARALADIGDPSVPAVAGVLANGDTQMVRVRAAWILKNIDSPTAHKAMSDRLQIETDPAMKKLLER
jgi:hypothetical protein